VSAEGPRAGELALAARLYADAARAATNHAERDHLARQAARLNGVLRACWPTSAQMGHRG
jgi:hypothetical protein